MKKTNAMRILDQAKIAYEILEYQYDPDNLSLEKIALDNQLKVGEVYKTIVAKGNKTGPIVAVVAGDASINLKALANLSANKKIALVPVKELLGLTGYIRGGCSPIGMKKSFPVFMEASTHQLESLYINAGKRGILIKLSIEDLVKITNGTIGAFAD